jgi:hypothetical protein
VRNLTLKLAILSDHRVPTSYVRREVRVRGGDGGWVDCITYVAVPDMVNEGLTPSPWYLQHLVRSRGGDGLPMVACCQRDEMRD